MVEMDKKETYETYTLPDVLVEEIMTKDVLNVDREDTLDDLIAMFRAHSVHGFPVLYEGKLVGMVTKIDLLKIFQRTGFRDTLVSHVKDIMRTHPTSIGPKSHIIDAVDTMIRQGFRLLPVLKEDTLIGVISYTDIINQVLKKP
ncbi:MAG: CBS domain-containing protein [Candidatus Hydrothermarchaeales archaeon]